MSLFFLNEQSFSQEYDSGKYKMAFCPVSHFDKMMSSDHHRKCRCADKTILQPSYLLIVILYTSKTGYQYIESGFSLAYVIALGWWGRTYVCLPWSWQHISTQSLTVSKHADIHVLTHWGRDKMDAISQTTLSNAFSWMKMCEFRLRFHQSLFLRVQLTIFQHWFR